MKFGENEGIQTENGELETLLPEMDGRTDLWTEAIHAASGENITVLRNVYARIMHSDMTEDGKSGGILFYPYVWRPLRKSLKDCKGREWPESRKISRHI